ncbi:hypothetical protein FGO68_gene5154 [Halteria grandinella]|uniref:Uncharacterized protein n=1 Tax=Halteria grandinella TaxID=5974 RepID=A0A8J8SX16_HALGN|nr:hypothetical protein FGO68_gene5154 [Halteria grandinella]
MKRHWITLRRTPFISVLDIALPVLLISILCFIRLKIPYTQMNYGGPMSQNFRRAGTDFPLQAGPLLEYATNLMPTVDPAKAIRYWLEERNRQSESLLNIQNQGINEKEYDEDVEEIESNTIKDYLRDAEHYFTKFLGQGILHGSPLFKFHPDNCRATRTSPERNLIAISPKDSEIAKTLQKDLEIFCKPHSYKKCVQSTQSIT